MTTTSRRWARALAAAMALAAWDAQAARGQAQRSAAADSAGIREAALNYIEGWYEGNAERMEQALHPELAKRIVQTNPNTGRSNFSSMSALTLIQGTHSGGGTRTPTADRRREVRILDVVEGAASARVDANDWVDYLQLARWNGRWVIVNVLWELRPHAP